MARMSDDELKAIFKESQGFGDQLLGQGTFKDTGRKSSGYGESLDSIVGAPARLAVEELQKGNINLGAFKRIISQIGADPKNAPTGFDIASKVTDNPYLGTALATAVDAGAQLPIPGMNLGVVGKIEDAKTGAQALLDSIKTPEQAAALKGAHREAYLKALDEIHGPREQRAKDMGFGKQTWYHGTGSDIEAFDPSLARTNAGGPTGEFATHFSKDPQLANQYAYEQTPEWYRQHLAEDNRIMRDALNKKPGASQAFKDYANGPRLEFENRLKDLPEGYQKESGNNVIPVRLKTKQMVGQELDGGSVGYDEAAFLKALKEEGKYGGAVFKNAYDNLNHTRFENPELIVPSTDIAAVLNPKDIRSVNAAFDPRFKSSSNLLAGQSGVGPMPINMAPTQDQSQQQNYAQGGAVSATPPSSAGPVLINTESGAAESLPDQQFATRALLTGSHGVPLVNQQGEIESFAHNDVGGALQNGYTEPSPEQLQGLLKTAKYGTTSQQVKGALEQVAQGVAGPLAPYLETKLGGVSAEDIRNRAESKGSLEKMIEQGVGLVGSSFIPGGQAKLLTKAGEIVNVGREALGLGEATSIVGKIGTTAAKAAVENSVFQAGDEVTKKILQDPNDTSGNVLANIGLAAAIGAGTGGAFGAVSPLWSATVGPKVEEMLGMIKNRANGETLPISQDLTTVLGNLEKQGVKVSPEIVAGLSDNPLAQDHFRQLVESGTTTGQAINETLNKFKGDVGDQLKSVFQKGAPMTSFEAGEAAKESIMNKIEELNKNVEEHFDRIAPDRAAISTSDEARQEAYKQMLKIGKEEFGEDSPQYSLFKNYGERVMARDSIAKLDQLRTELFSEIKGARSFANPQFEKARALGTIRDFIGDFQDNQIGAAAKDLHVAQGMSESAAKAKADELLENTKAARKVYKEFIGSIGDVASAGKLGKVSSYGQLIEAMDKVPSAKFADKLFDPKNIEGLRELQKAHPEAFDAIMQAKKTSMLESATTKGDLMHNQLLNNVNKLPKEVRDMMFNKEEQDTINASGRILRESGKRLNPSGTAKTLDKLWASVPTGAGAFASMLLGHNPIAGMIIGQASKFLGRDAPDAAKMALLKYLGSAGSVDAEGFKAANDYIRAAIKGQMLIQKASKAALKAGQEVLPKSFIPDQKSRDKLDKKLKELQVDNSSMLDVGGKIGSLMPDHAGNLAGVSINAVNYLNSIRPQVQKASPLDTEIEPTKMATSNYNRALDIAEQPLVLLQSIQNGTLTPMDIKHLVTMYPQVHDNLTTSLTDAMVKQTSKEEPIEYKQRMSLSLFMGQPLDSTMTPQAIIAAQPPPPTNPTSQPSQRQHHHGSMKNVEKLASGNATSGQMREMQKAGMAKA